MSLLTLLKYPLPDFTDHKENTKFLISLPKDLQKNCLRAFDTAAGLHYNTEYNDVVRSRFLHESITHLLLTYID